MTSWQRRARLVAGVVAVAAAARRVLGDRQPTRRLAPPPPVTPLAPTVTAQVQGGEAAQTQRRPRGLLARRSRNSAPTPTAAPSPPISRCTSPTAAARSFVVAGKEGTIGADQSSVVMTGDVVLEASDGLVAKTDTRQLRRRRGHRAGAGPGHLHTRAHQGDGRRVHLRQEPRHDVGARQGQPCTWTAAPEGDAWTSPPGPFGDARRDRYMRLERDVQRHASRPDDHGRRGDGLPAARIATSPTRSSCGATAAITGGAGMGTLRAMKARDINLDYADDGRTLQHATLAGRGDHHAGRRASAAQPGQRLAAEWIDLALGARRRHHQPGGARAAAGHAAGAGRRPGPHDPRRRAHRRRRGRRRADRRCGSPAASSFARAAPRKTPPTRVAKSAALDAGARPERRRPSARRSPATRVRRRHPARQRPPRHAT